MEKKNLPTINEIVKMELSEREKGNALNVLLNQPPPQNWLKKQGNVWHLPVDKVKRSFKKCKKTELLLFQPNQPLPGIFYLCNTWISVLP